MRPRLALVLLLCLLPAMAAPAAALPGAGGAFAWLWSFVPQSWGLGRLALPAELDLGCTIDPSGTGCRTQQLDLGCTIEPDGAGCRPASIQRLGCTIDPHGQPAGCSQRR